MTLATSRRSGPPLRLSHTMTTAPRGSLLTCT